MKKIILFVFILSIFISTNQVYAETEVSGNITANTTWTLISSPYIVTETVQVLNGAKLTIEPGVMVKFNNATGLSIGGELIALGTADNIITFTSNQLSQQAGDWVGIRFLNTSVGANFDSNFNYINGSVIKYTKITYATYAHGSSSSAALSGDVSLFIDNNIIEFSKYSAVFINASKSKITNNIIKNNGLDPTAGGNSAILVTQSNQYIENNIIDNNGQGGITLNNTSNSYIVTNKLTNNRDGLIISEGSNNKIENNLIEGNSQVGINYTEGLSPGTGNVIRNNRIKDNGRAGIFLSKNNDHIGTVNIINNNIYNNVSNFELYSSTNIETKKNYWGTADTSVINSKIFDYYDDISLGKVNYEPYALAELKFDGTDTFSQLQVCTSWTYSDWGACTNNQQNRTVVSSQPTNCAGGNPVLTQSCNSTPLCTENNWTSILAPTSCPNSNQQTKTWTKIGQCLGGISKPSQETISCSYQTPTCNSFTYSDWGICNSSGIQSRTTTFSSPSNCVGGSPVLNKSCTYISSCTSDIWSCDNWSNCSINSLQTRICNKTFECPIVDTPSPLTLQSCIYSQQLTSLTPVVSPSTFATSSTAQTNLIKKVTYNLGTKTLKNGSKGEPVKELQRFLNITLNLGLIIDGKLGPKTIAVIKKWQKDNGLVADGLIGAKTKAMILLFANK